MLQMTQRENDCSQKGRRMEALIGNMSPFFCLYIKKECSKIDEEH